MIGKHLVLVGILAATAGAAVAQGVPQAPSVVPGQPAAELQDIVVTAQKREEKLQNVPIAVTALDAAAIENTNQQSIADLSATVPNFQIGTGGSGPGASLITLRGLSFQDIEKSFEPPIGLVVDGVYLSTSTGQVAQTFDFDRIEVLAGPQGTLFGKNTTGGVINITRSKPNPSDDDIHGKVRITGGSFGERDFEGVVLIPVIKDVLAVKFAAFSQNNDGAFKDVTLHKNLGDRDYQAFSFGVDFRPDENSDIYAIFDRTLDHSQLNPLLSALTPNALPLPTGGFIDGRDTICLNPYLPGACVNASGKIPGNVVTQNRPQHAGYDLYAATVDASYNLDPVNLVSVFGYRSESEEAQNDYDATQYTLFNTNRPETYRQISEEVRAETNFDGPFNITVGGYYFYSNYTLTQYSFLDFAAVLPIPPGLAASYFGQYTHQGSYNESIFAQATYDITDQLRLIVGGRQSFDQKGLLFTLYNDNNLSSFASVKCPNNAAVTECQNGRAYHTWSQFTPKVGLQYRFDPDLMAYATYSKGYNAGGFNGRAGDLSLIGPYAPEQVHSIEIGAKSSWFDHRLRLDVAAFESLFNNAQEEIIQQGTSNATSTTVANAADINYAGFEIEAAGKPIPDWTLSLNFGYLNAYYRSFYAALLAGPAVDNSSLTVRRVPPVTVGFNSDYIIPLEEGDVGLNLNLRYIDGQQFDLLNDPRGYQGPVSKLDLAARYERKFYGLDWTLTGFVKNISDETPKNTLVTGYQGSFVEFWSQEIGRTFGVTLEAKF